MSEDRYLPENVAEVAARLSDCRGCGFGANTEKGLGLAGRQAVYQVLDDLVAILFPGCHGHGPIAEEEMGSAIRRKLEDIAATLARQVEMAFCYQCTIEPCEGGRDECQARSRETVSRLVSSLPALKETLQEDLVAAYEGDPAARSVMEVVMSYPGFQAIVTHRIAHLLYEDGVPLIPRIMSERAHSMTGIDIHPGARIGKGFFIDHGTGVVIGETCVIGERVKIYQGVTLGALSFAKDSNGRLVKGTKRHPDVGDNVTLYSGATILGGTTTIGAGSEIGGNVWLTHSVPPNSKVYNQQPRPLIRSHSGAAPEKQKPEAGRDV